MNINRVCIYWCDVKQLQYSEEQIKKCESLIGIECPNYLRIEDVTRHITGLLLAELAFNYYWDSSKSSNELLFSRVKQDKGRKPFFTNNSQLDFSVSHSDEIVLCAIASCDVGVDIEKAATPIFDLMDKICNEDELKWLRSNGSIEASYCLWTYKESFLKCTGEGIKKIKNTISMIENGKLIKEYDEYYFRKIMIRRGYEAALCVKKPVDLMSIEEVRTTCLEEFLNKMRIYC